MSNYIGEIRMFAGNRAPAGWLFCHGQSLPIAENEALFQLIGTVYGGDGQETFNLPNLAARIPMGSDYTNGGWGSQWVLGELRGTESVTLTTSQMPLHDHALLGTVDVASSSTPAGKVPASLPSVGTASAYGTRAPTGAIDATSIQPAGGSQPHDNMQPYLTVSFIISLFGVFPQPT